MGEKSNLAEKIQYVAKYGLVTFVGACALLSVGVQESVAVEQQPNVAVSQNELPDALPRKVAERIPDVVQVIFDNTTIVSNIADELDLLVPNKLIKPDAFSATGLRVAEDEYVTARHLIVDADSWLYKGAETCGGVEVHVPGDKFAGVGRRHQDGIVEPLYGRVDPADDIAVVHKGTAGVLDNTAMLLPFGAQITPDVALIRAVDDEELTPKFKGLLTRETPLKIGEPFFFVNYQPDAQGNSRSPLRTKQEAIGKKDVSNLEQPAVVGGIFAGYLENGILIVVTGFKGYDSTQDRVLFRGSSGGPMFDNEGMVVGLSVAIANQVAKKASSDLLSLARAAGQTNISEDTQIQFVLVEPLSKSRIGQYESMLLQDTRDCSDENR